MKPNVKGRRVLLLRKSIRKNVMKKIASLPLIALCGVLFASASANAASAPDTVSDNEYSALLEEHPALKQRDGEMGEAYRQARSVIGDEGAYVELGSDQHYWMFAVRRAALSKGPAGSPEMIGFLTDATGKRTETLRAVAAEGRVLERQLFRTNGGIERHLEILKYAEGRVKLTFGIYTDGGYGSCTIHARTSQDADGAWSFDFPDLTNAVASAENGDSGYVVSLRKTGIVDCAFYSETTLPPDAMTIPDVSALQTLSLTLAVDAEAYAAKAGLTNGHNGKLKGIFALAGDYRRTNKPVRADDPTLEEVIACTLGADRSQKVRLLRNDRRVDSHVYYVESSQGLIPLDSLADASLRGTYDEVDRSRGTSLSLSCGGDGKERVLTVSGEFTSGYRHIHVIRYNSAQEKWQVLRTAERMPPSRIYLGKNDMKVTMPDLSSSVKPYLVHTVGNGKQVREEREKLPATKGYHVIRIEEAYLEERTAGAENGK